MTPEKTPEQEFEDLARRLSQPKIKKEKPIQETYEKPSVKEHEEYKKPEKKRKPKPIYHKGKIHSNYLGIPSPPSNSTKERTIKEKSKELESIVSQPSIEKPKEEKKPHQPKESIEEARAHQLFKKGQYKGAIQELKKAVHSNPIDYIALHLLGKCYSELGKHKKALGFYEKAINHSASKNISEFHADYANSLIQLGKYEEAIGEIIIAQSLKYDVFHFILEGRLREKQRQMWVSKSRKLSVGKFFYGLFNLGTDPEKIDGGVGKLEEALPGLVTQVTDLARKSYRQALEMDPKNEEAFQYLRNH